MRTVDEIKADIETADTFSEKKELLLEYYYVVGRDITGSRLEKICEAERDGRCVVLPCKVGDTVYASHGERIITGTISEIMCNAYGWVFRSDSESPVLQWRMISNIGKTVFLTRAEAEEALKEG